MQRDHLWFDATILIICVVIFYGCVSRQSYGGERDPGSYPTVCRIRVPGSDGASLGSGCCIYSQATPPASYVLTASHVVRGATGYPTVTFPNGRSFRCKVIYNNRRKDVAVLAFGATMSHYTALSTRVPNRGERVTFVGYGGRRPYFLPTQDV